jgi:F0F1-type ATP synthase assembly protein I
MNLFAQASHIVMTLNVIWVVYVTLKTAHFKPLAIGLLLGILLFIPYISYNQHYCRTHVEDLQQILQIK